MHRRGCRRCGQWIIPVVIGSLLPGVRGGAHSPVPSTVIVAFSLGVPFVGLIESARAQAASCSTCQHRLCKVLHSGIKLEITYLDLVMHAWYFASSITKDSAMSRQSS
ncbi:hypothetical protein BKA93DRAFT_784350 [Sparassis latifolia]